MNKRFNAQIFATALTIFAMLFGAGNLMFPLRLGIHAGTSWFTGFFGFMLTGVMLPVLGLIAIVLFQGSYENFFARLGRIPAAMLVFFCMAVIGPVVVMPRIILLSYEMLQPFLPAMSPFAFACGFSTLAFLASWKPGRLLDIVGKVLSPLKVLSIVAIVIIGVVTARIPLPASETGMTLFLHGFNEGYKTLDLLGSIFFGSIIVSLLARYSRSSSGQILDRGEAAKITGIASIFAAGLLSAVYGGMTYLAAHHGEGLAALNEGQIFSVISFRVLGAYGAALIGFTVFLACFTTTVSLTAVVSDYVKRILSADRMSYSASTAVVLGLSAVISSVGLSTILAVTGPLITASYPFLIIITLCNILYASFGFSYMRLPLAAYGSIYLLYLVYISIVS